MNRPLRIALTKGRLEKDTIGLLEKIGYDFAGGYRQHYQDKR